MFQHSTSRENACFLCVAVNGRIYLFGDWGIPRMVEGMKVVTHFVSIFNLYEKTSHPSNKPHKHFHDSVKETGQTSFQILRKSTDNQKMGWSNGLTISVSEGTLSRQYT